MFQRSSQRFSKLMPCVLSGAVLSFGSALPATAQTECDPEAAPYLFILFDTSGSLNRAPSCSQAEIDAELCSHLCAGYDCFAPLQADGPDSKLFQMKSALHEALSSPEAENLLFGFASFNQDALYARSKHWLYEAAGNGVTIPGWGGFLPAAGSRDVLGRVWTCDEGSGDDEVGCLPANPADLSDAWELARVRTLAKGGETFTSTVTFYVRHAGATYRIRYIPTGAWTPGVAVSFQVRRERCLNASCSAVDPAMTVTVGYTPVSEYLVWENGASRTEPVGYFGQTGAADSSAGNTCSGWDPNTDTTSDRYNNYSLRWPTFTGDPRGTYFTQGDVLPLDWLADHREDIQKRLAPNLVLDPLAVPDFRTSPYLRDTRFGAETFLRLKDDWARPLVATGSTPQGNSLRNFRAWYAGCAAGTCPPTYGWYGVAAAQDPEFSCRRHNLVLITDGEDTCNSASYACSAAASLYAQHGLRTYVVAFSANPVTSTVDCIADNGGTTAPFEVHLRSELVQALKDIFVAAGQP